MGITYKDSGVDIEAGSSFVKRIAPMVRSTFSHRVITEIGGFGALFSGAFEGYKDPVLVSGTDGAGTKIQIARMMNKHDTIGIDVAAMCVNDIVVSGAVPLFFLDYISCGRLNENILTDVVKGIVAGCKEAGCSLIGGETAEHPDVVDPDDYDIAGFAVGLVDREKIISGSSIKKGDLIIGLPSSGLHSNGFSLVRKLFFEIKKYDIDLKLPELPDKLGNVLLTPTKIYVKEIMKCLESGIDIKGIVHITGGGFYENIPRILPDNCAVKIDPDSYNVPVIFDVIRKEGSVSKKEMHATFNMGIGMMLFLDRESADGALEKIKNMSENAAIIGEVIDYGDGERVVI